MGTVITAVEWTPFPISHFNDDTKDLIYSLAKEGRLSISYNPHTAETIAKSEGFVGFIKRGDIEIHLIPRLMTENIIAMLSYALSPPSKMFSELISARKREEIIMKLPEIMAMAFVKAAKDIIRKGLRKTYSRKFTDTDLKGRIIRKLLPRYTPFTGKLPMEVWNMSFNTKLNEILLATALYLRKHTLSPKISEELSSLITFLSLLEIPQRQLSRRLVKEGKNALNRTNIYYMPATDIAEILVSGIPESSQGNSPSFTGFIVDMAQLFEKATLTYLRSIYPRVEYQRKIHIFEGAHTSSIRPDFILHTDEDNIIVADAKYREVEEEPSEILYQVITYMEALGTDTAHIYYPATTRDMKRRETTAHLSGGSRRILWIPLNFCDVVNSPTLPSLWTEESLR